jgi:hypothetical protein
MHWLHADGPPDEAEYQDISDLFIQLMGFG